MKDRIKQLWEEEGDFIKAYALGVAVGSISALVAYHYAAKNEGFRMVKPLGMSPSGKAYDVLTLTGKILHAPINNEQ